MKERFIQEYVKSLRAMAHQNPSALSQMAADLYKELAGAEPSPELGTQQQRATQIIRGLLNDVASEDVRNALVELLVILRS